jgi:hypothetical protein
VKAVNPLVALYDIHGGKRQMIFLCSVPDITRDHNRCEILSNLLMISVFLDLVQFRIRGTVLLSNRPAPRVLSVPDVRVGTGQCHLAG